MGKLSQKQLIERAAERAVEITLARLGIVPSAATTAAEESMSTLCESKDHTSIATGGDADLLLRAREFGARLPARLRQREKQRKQPKPKRSATAE